MTDPFSFDIRRTPFDEHYQPAGSTRLTTNFANLARGDKRQQNLRNTLRMIDNRFNNLATWDNPEADRYAVALDIVSVDMRLNAGREREGFPLIELLQTRIHDKREGRWLDGLVGNSFSSYVRDYDFSVLLPSYNAGRTEFGLPPQFGELHGKLFTQFVGSQAYAEHFAKPPVICISVATSRTYRRTGNHHPVLGMEYQQDEPSSTDHYFAKMGLNVRFFMPANSVAPLAFYFQGDLLADYTNLELIGTISTMEAFQKIYRPEIYNANSAAGACYRPSLHNHDYSVTQIVYDREERSQLALKQGRYAEEHLIKPHQHALQQWVADVGR